MSLKDSDSDTSPAVIMAAQDDFTDSMREGEQDPPGSPTSDEWEVVPDQSEQSDCGSSAKSLLLDDTPANSPKTEEDTHADLPTLHVRLLPQGSSDVTVHLTAQHQAGPPPKTPLTPGGSLSDSARQQYQEQLRKAQETMLPQSSDSRANPSGKDSASRTSNSDSRLSESVDAQGENLQADPFEQDSVKDTSIREDAFEGVDGQGERLQAKRFEQDSVKGASIPEEEFEAVDAEGEMLQAEASDDEVLEELMDADLPTSTHMSMQDDTVDAASPTYSEQSSVTDTGTDAADESAEQAEVDSAPAVNSLPFPVYDSTGELSFMSDGSFINLEDAMSEEQAGEKLTKDESEDVHMDDSSAEAMSVNELSQQASDLAHMAKQLSEEIAESKEEDCDAALETDAAADDDDDCNKIECDDQEAEGGEYYKPNGLVASLQYRLGQLLSTIQAWTATAYASLPHSATVYNSTLGVFGPKSPLRSLDKLHWSLASGLALVSAALSLYIVKNQHMQKQVTSSSTELSRLLLKVINLQQSLQSPGRVPIIRHTSSISSITPFPLTHLM